MLLVFSIFEPQMNGIHADEEDWLWSDSNVIFRPMTHSATDKLCIADRINPA